VVRVVTVWRCGLQVVDPNSGRTYWCQPTTGVSTWSRPAGLTSSEDDSEDSSDDEEDSGSDSSGGERPSASDSEQGGGGDTSSDSGSGSDGDSSDDSDDGGGSDTGGFGEDAVGDGALGKAVRAAIQQGWRKVLDGSTGKTYYANRVTGQSRYVVVVSVTLPAGGGLAVHLANTALLCCVRF